MSLSFMFVVLNWHSRVLVLNPWPVTLLDVVVEVLNKSNTLIKRVIIADLLINWIVRYVKCYNAFSQE